MKDKKPVLSNGIFLKGTTYEVSSDNAYGYPGGWDAQMKALSYTGTIGPIEYWKSDNSMSKSREVELTLSIQEYCKKNNISWKQLAEREGIHMRAMRGIMNTRHLDDVTTMRLLYGIGKVPTNKLIKYLTLCKKNRKYEKYIK